MVTEILPLRYGLSAELVLSEDARPDWVPEKPDPRKRCAATVAYVEECPCPKHRASKGGRLAL